MLSQKFKELKMKSGKKEIFVFFTKKRGEFFTPAFFHKVSVAHIARN